MGLYRTIINGTSVAPGEVWSVGFNWRSPIEGSTYERLLQWADEITLDIGGLVGNDLIELLSTAGAITMVRVEERDEATEELLQAAESLMAIPKAGAGTVSKTLQTSLCVSLLTGRAGRSYRGRGYWPAWAYTGTTAALFGSANLTTWVAAFRELVNLQQAAASIGVGPLDVVLVVRSRLLHVSTDVVQYAVGTVPDTQRRRRDAIAETYTTLAV